MSPQDPTDPGEQHPDEQFSDERQHAGDARKHPAGGNEPGPGRRLMDSLSARSRGEGWEKPQGELAKYRSTWRAGVRFVLQRVIFRAVVNSAVTPQVKTHRRVKSIRGPFVLVANHTSHVDGPLLAMSLPWTQGRFLCTGVATDYWFDHWHRRIFVRLMMNAFPIDRGGSRKHSGTSRKLLRSGVPILVFPEGGRQTTGKMADFKPGAAALAIGVGVPVVPAAIIGGYEAMPKGRSWPTKGRPPVAVVFGDPMISHEHESAVAFSERIRERVKNLYDEHHDEVLGAGVRDEEGPA
ncbi:acyl-phosphate glycerol 3-phosphate acyltransferase [Brachybacterium sp. P6-10-X1]|uniref:lysophospholipid acyltransferase family protein n=1 Tax=Brachybacterium sp. P6-10-X1 TaxID=1903186 RepID=UPI000971BAC7|nr:lysophospholipid acyltransferase family protein [Brachybacterium sp. P6-10-X1]APX33000.1 acyl-phosphate glycerol 3-phosphate acyltransferase [Brachybacterium sp. P6-10-X1]